MDTAATQMTPPHSSGRNANEFNDEYTQRLVSVLHATSEIDGGLTVVDYVRDCAAFELSKCVADDSVAQVPPRQHNDGDEEDEQDRFLKRRKVEIDEDSDELLSTTQESPTRFNYNNENDNANDTNDLDDNADSAFEFNENICFNDPIHGHMEFHPLTVKIIDTPQFQRLRRLKQLGVGYFVFPGASHNRFEHSLGVCYLAGLMVKRLKDNQPKLGITDVDLICVTIAGLVHDLGHGPFSHQFEDLIKRARPNKQWVHEMASLDMFDALYKENHLASEFKKYKLNVDESDPTNDLVFIKELILGEPINDVFKKDEDKDRNFLGRPKSKWFLYQIVANKITGTDVDKWDYFLRDSYHLGIKTSFDYNRFLITARCGGPSNDEEKYIMFREKEAVTLYDMFSTRDSLHRRAYQHKTVMIISAMVNEILYKANDHLTIMSKKFSETIDDMQAYTALTDEILLLIEISEKKELKEAKEILKRVRCRDLYKYIGETSAKQKNCQNPNQIQDFSASQFQGHCAEIVKLIDDPELVADGDLIMFKQHFSYGQGPKDPIAMTRFYRKDGSMVKIQREQVSQMLPTQFQESKLILVHTNNNNDQQSKKLTKNVKDVVERAFEKWCRMKEFIVPTASGKYRHHNTGDDDVVADDKEDDDDEDGNGYSFEISSTPVKETIAKSLMAQDKTTGTTTTNGIKKKDLKLKKKKNSCGSNRTTDNTDNIDLSRVGSPLSRSQNGRQ